MNYDREYSQNREPTTEVAKNSYGDKRGLREALSSTTDYTEFFPHNIPIRLLYGIIPLEQLNIALASSSILAYPRFNSKNIPSARGHSSPPLEQALDIAGIPGLRMYYGVVMPG
jgi:hypothetical protein